MRSRFRSCEHSSYPGAMVYDRSQQPDHVQQWQDVLNEHWPPDPGNMRRMPWREGIPVTARIMWERDSEEWVDGVARRWDADHVYVEILDDVRLSGNGAWLRPDDVKRPD